ncbi:ODV-E66A [Spodoptera cosmioides nucleopolyhedrovirus]|uniref:ODV-E66A n=1 Tax=Spodoptera cosmioides nucleopolyhedrovirus TaxID=2605774 RepID=A0A6B7KGR7_9ABAC|nr:ODV-E66A [Spodoptera cosmioides nucleopolyhedrovirus]
MWLYVFMIAIFVVFVIILMWQTNIVIVDLETQNNYNHHYYYHDEYYIYDDDYNDESAEATLMTNHLNTFEEHYLASLPIKFLQKTEKILKPTRQFSDDDNIFVGLEPWLRVADFGTLLHTLIGYGVRFRDVDDALYLDFKLAYRLNDAMYTIYDCLPNNWSRFNVVALAECFQNTCIVLRGFYDLTDVTESILYHYLPAPALSKDHDNNDNTSSFAVVVRACLPYVYGQLLRGYTFDEIASEERVRHIIESSLKTTTHLVKAGNSGIRYDYAYFDDADTRVYDNLIDGYFTFSYYNFMFGPNTVNLDNVHKSIMLIGSNNLNDENRCIVNDALISQSAKCTVYSEALAGIMDYPYGVYAADFSKILTVRNDSYFGSIVGHTFDVVAPYRTIMVRKIWPNQTVKRRRNINYNDDDTTRLGLESGVLIFDDKVPFVSETNSLYPSLAFTAIATTANAGVMIMHARFEELNLEFHSYTLYHRHGMFHLYDRIKSLQNISHDARCVVLARDTSLEPKWMASANTLQSNGVVAKHHTIINGKNLSNFQVRTFEHLNVQTAEQTIDAELVNSGAGVACFSLLTNRRTDDDTIIEHVPENDAFIITVDSICCVIHFPVVILRDDDTRQITINDATNVSRTIHHLSFDKIATPLSLISMSVDNLKFSSQQQIQRQQDRFVLHDVHGDEFKFHF